MKPTYSVLLHIFLLSCTLYSCSKFDEHCRGELNRLDHTGANIVAEDTIETSNGRYRHTVALQAVATHTDIDVNKGKRCKTRTLEIGTQIGDVIDSNSLSITCNKSFSWYNKRTVQAGENLLHVDIFENHFGYWHTMQGSIDIFIDADSIETGLYTFYGEATTYDGNIYKDTVSVYYN